MWTKKKTSYERIYTNFIPDNDVDFSYSDITSAGVKAGDVKQSYEEVPKDTNDKDKGSEKSGKGLEGIFGFGKKK